MQTRALEGICHGLLFNRLPVSCPSQMIAKPSESPVGRQHQSHPEETEEELREHQDGGALPPGVTIKQEPPDPQELEEEALQQQQHREHRERERQAEQELLFRQVGMKRETSALVYSCSTTWAGRINMKFQRIDSPTLLGTNVL